MNQKLTKQTHYNGTATKIPKATPTTQPISGDFCWVCLCVHARKVRTQTVGLHLLRAFLIYHSFSGGLGMLIYVGIVLKVGCLFVCSCMADFFVYFCDLRIFFYNQVMFLVFLA